MGCYPEFPKKSPRKLEKISKSRIENMSAGGQRPNAGRKKGSPNKVTAEIKKIAQEHGPDALKELLRIMKNGTSEQARIAAAKEVLDRAYGKPVQALVADPNEPPIRPYDRIEFVIVDPKHTHPQPGAVAKRLGGADQ
jgi:hypothetical protein